MNIDTIWKMLDKNKMGRIRENEFLQQLKYMDKIMSYGEGNYNNHQTKRDDLHSWELE